MKEMDDILKSVFHDKPIAQEPLQGMRMRIMDQILAAPVDFREKRLAMQRRKWGIIFLSAFFVLSLSLFLINWFLGSWLGGGLNTLVLWLTANIPILAWFQDRWVWLFDTLTILSNLKLGYQFLWQQYGLAVMGILFSWVLFEGIRDNKLKRKVFNGNS
ncbi:hypothetical protein [Desulfitobacterium sp. PCE1]|uniref:hypothetical protein n=1 Tax=Desulfitobacterium sp. PCE1 TaxID=146907 RepID=UPI0003609F95|nr:hypothetical protein [Desulfitobacterium sp. PCE1]